MSRKWQRSPRVAVVDLDVCNALTERLIETINDFTEANTATTTEVLAAIDRAYACAERSCKRAPAWRKMH